MPGWVNTDITCSETGGPESDHGRCSDLFLSLGSGLDDWIAMHFDDHFLGVGTRWQTAKLPVVSPMANSKASSIS